MPFTDFLPGLFRKADPEPTTPAPVNLTDPLAAWLFGAQPTYSNISVTPKTAMQVPAVALAVQTIANAVGGLPVKLYVRNGKGKEADPANPAFTLAHDEANPWTSAAELRAQLTRDAQSYSHPVPRCRRLCLKVDHQSGSGRRAQTPANPGFIATSMT